MQNSTNSTNNPSAKVKAEVNSFLGSGTYDIVKVTKQVGDRGLEFIAEVRRWNYKHWVNQIVNLSYLFNSTSVGPMLRYQPETLVDSVININCTQKETNLGKVFYTYSWEINAGMTEVIQSEIQESINEQNNQEYELGEIIYQEEQEWLNEQYYQEEMEYLEGVEILQMHHRENTEEN